jgi:hypothetical protein
MTAPNHREKHTEKIKVIEVEATKLDPEADYLIICNRNLMTMQQMRDMAYQLNELGTKFVIQYCAGPPAEAVKVYQIPRKDTP